MNRSSSRLAIAACTLALTACIDAPLVTEPGWPDEEPRFDTAEPQSRDACADGVDVEFSGQPINILPTLSGLRESTATLADGSTVNVTFDAELPSAQSWWEWTERDGLCWSTLTVEPSQLRLNVADGSVRSGERVTVLTSAGTAMLVVELSASSVLLGGVPEERVAIQISRTKNSERGSITDAAGTELLRW